MSSHKSTTAKFLSLLIASAMCVSAIGCEETPAPEPIEATTVYRSEYIDLPEDFILSFDSLAAVGGKVIAGGYVYSLEDETITDSLIEIDVESGSATVAPVASGSRSNKTLYGDDGLRAEVTSEINDMVYESMTLTLYDGGEVEAVYDLAELFDIDLSRFELSFSGDGGFDIVLLSETDDYFYIVSNTGALRLNPDGSHLKVDSQNEITAAAQNEDKLILISENGSKNEATYVDFTNLVLGEPFDIPDGTPFMLNGYDVGIFNSSGIYGLILDETGVIAENLICDFVASDIASQVNAVVSLSENCFYAIMIDLVDNERRLCRLDMLTEDELDSRKTLKLAALGCMNAQLLYYSVSEFNRTNSEYKIEISEYYGDSSKLADFEARQAEQQRFTNDIMAGNTPDIFYINEMFYSGMTETLERQGLFCDLYTLMDQNGYPRENIIAPVRESLERESRQTGNTCLPYLPLYMSVNTLLGRRSDFPNGLTLDKALDIIESGGQLLNRMTINDLLRLSIDEFINFETGETYFTGETFKRLCEIYKNWSDYIESYDSEDPFTEHLVMLKAANAFSSVDLIKARYRDGIEDVEAIGYPSIDGGASFIGVNEVYAISEASEYKDAAFEFLKLRLSDRYINSMMNNGLKLTQNTFDESMDSIYRYYMINLDGSIGMSNTPPADDMSYAATFTADDEFIDQIRSVYTSARIPAPMTSDILAIILDELMTFASRPEMTVDEVVEIIDNRVGIYYNERK